MSAIPNRPNATPTQIVALDGGADLQPPVETMQADTRQDKTQSGTDWMRPAHSCCSGSNELSGRGKNADEREWEPNRNGQAETKSAWSESHGPPLIRSLVH